MWFKDRATIVGFQLAWWLGKRLPKVVLVTLFQIFSKQMFHKNGKSVKRLRFNLARVMGLPINSAEVSVLSARNLNNYFRYWAEMFHLRAVPNSKVSNLVTVKNPEVLDAALEIGRGVLVVAPHSGNWDVAGAAIALQYGGITTVAERLKPEALFDLFVSSRIGRNIEILPHRGGARPAFDVMCERLNQGKIVALATDRDLSRSGIEVEFFGAKSKMPSGPARLFQATDCVVLSVELCFKGAKTEITFRHPLEFTGETVRDTQVMATEFEEIIQTHPEHWFMLQQVWFDHPPEWGGRA